MTGRSVVMSILRGFFLGLVLVSASFAHAGRVLVYFKDKQTHNRFQTDLYLKNESSVMLALSSAGQEQTEIKATLPRVGAWVVESHSSLEALKASLPAGAIIETERFRPSPKPIVGYALTPAWNFAFKAKKISDTENNENENTEETDNIAPMVIPKRPFGIDLVKAVAAWPLSKQGAGAKVAILDTGIDKNHPALAANFVMGEDFVDDNNSPYPFADKEGHGTHVAGTIAATELSEGFIGVAPQADLYIGRVCGLEGCSNVAIASAIDWAVSQKVDVISMSLGGNWLTEAERRAIAAAEVAGVVVVAASGNDGTGRVSYPAALDTVIAVGAVSSDKKKADFSQFGPELDVVAPGVDTVSSVPVGSGRESQVSFANGSGAFEEVRSVPFVGAVENSRAVRGSMVFCQFGNSGQFPESVRGKFALISRGEIAFTDKVKNALAAGATGVIFFNNQPGLVQGSASENDQPVAVPVVMIEKTSGEKIRDQLAAGTDVKVSIKTVASDYASYSGTSMATPHVSGVVALIRAAKPGLAPAAVREVLKRTAEKLGPNNRNEYGSGLVDAEKAVTQALGQ